MYNFSSSIFSAQLSKHHHHLITGQFHPSERKPLNPLRQSLSSLLPASGSSYFLSLWMGLIWTFSYKQNLVTRGLLCLALSLNQRAVFDWDLLCLTSRFSIPVLTIIKWAVLAGWRRKRFCARKREEKEHRERKTHRWALYFLRSHQDWGPVRGASVSQHLPDLDSEESFCLPRASTCTRQCLKSWEDRKDEGQLGAGTGR